MTIEEIRKNAPKGATHYRQFSSSIRYVKYTGDIDYFWTNDGWVEFSVKNLPLDVVKKLKPLH